MERFKCVKVVSGDPVTVSRPAPPLLPDSLQKPVLGPRPPRSTPPRRPRAESHPRRVAPPPSVPAEPPPGRVAPCRVAAPPSRGPAPGRRSSQTWGAGPCDMGSLPLGQPPPDSVPSHPVADSPAPAAPQAHRAPPDGYRKYRRSNTWPLKPDGPFGPPRLAPRPGPRKAPAVPPPAPPPPAPPAAALPSVAPPPGASPPPAVPPPAVPFPATPHVSQPPSRPLTPVPSPGRGELRLACPDSECATRC
jgi:hypothetical protein